MQNRRKRDEIQLTPVFKQVEEEKKPNKGIKTCMNKKPCYKR